MKQFDEIIQQKANNHEASVPADAWNNIKKKKRKRRFVFFWLIFALLLAGGITILTQKDNDNKGKIISLAKKQPTAGSNLYVNQNNVPEEKGSITTAGTIDKNNFIKPAEEIVRPSGNILLSKTGNKDLAGSKNNKRSVNTVMSEDDIKTSAPVVGKIKRSKKITGKTSSKIIAAVAEEPFEDKKEVTQTDTAITNEKKDQSDNHLTADKKPLQIKDSTKKLTNNDLAAVKKDNRKKKKKRKVQPWYVDISATPLFTIRQQAQPVSLTRTNVGNNSLAIFSANGVNSNIDPAIAFSIVARKELNRRITLGIGLQYLQLKEHISISGNETNTQYSIVNSLVNGPGGPSLVNDTIQVITEGKRNIEAINSYRLWSVPVFMQYHIIKKHSWALSAVIGLNVTIAGNYKNEINRNAVAQLVSTGQSANDKNKMGLDLSTGIRLGKTINSRIELFALPAMRWNLRQSHIKNSLLNKKIQQAGVAVGLGFKLN